MAELDQTRIYVVDDDVDFARSLIALLIANRFVAAGFESGERFLDEQQSLMPGIVMLDVKMPGMDGLTFLNIFQEGGAKWPVVMMTGHGDIPLAVRCIQAGAIDFIQKPFDEDTLLRGLSEATQILKNQLAETALAEREKAKLQSLSKRESEVLAKIVDGQSNKQIAGDLDISVRTVEMHRANLMRRLKVRTMPDLIKIGMQLQG